MMDHFTSTHAIRGEDYPSIGSSVTDEEYLQSFEPEEVSLSSISSLPPVGCVSVDLTVTNGEYRQACVQTCSEDSYTSLPSGIPDFGFTQNGHPVDESVHGHTGLTCHPHPSAELDDFRAIHSRCSVNDNRLDSLMGLGDRMSTMRLSSGQGIGPRTPREDGATRVDSPELHTLLHYRCSDGGTILHELLKNRSPHSMMAINHSPTDSWLNIADNESKTPLHVAVESEFTPLVRRLVVGGAHVDACDHQGNMPLHIACQKGDLDSARALLDPVQYEETAHNRYQIPYQKIPQDQEDRNAEGLTFLQVAAKGMFLDIMQLLISKGADINVRDHKTGRTILMQALLDKNMPLVEFMAMAQYLDALDLTVQDNNGSSLSDLLNAYAS